MLIYDAKKQEVKVLCGLGSAPVRLVDLALGLLSPVLRVAQRLVALLLLPVASARQPMTRPSSSMFGRIAAFFRFGNAKTGPNSPIHT